MKNLIEKIKAWFLKHWLVIVNYLVIFLAYIIVYDHEEVVFAETVLGLWLFASVGYYVYETFMKK